MNEKIIIYLDRVFKLNLTLFPYVISQSIVLLLVETFTYKGLASKYLFLPVEIWLVLSILSGVMTLLTTLSIPKLAKNLLSQYKLFKYILPVLTVNMILIYLLLMLGFYKEGETISYGGRFLIYPDRFMYAILLTLYFAILSNLLIRVNENRSRLQNVTNIVKDRNISLPSSNIIYKFIAIIVISLLLKSSVSQNSKLFIYNVKNMLKSPFASYDEKMSSQIGPIYRYYKFVTNSTPSSAVILHPTQQGQWPDVSNAGFTRYFIYPRNLVAEEDREANMERITHVFLIGSRKLHDNAQQNNWPDFYVPAERVIYYRRNSNESIVVAGDYHPEDIEKYGGRWGIIEVKRDAQW